MRRNNRGAREQERKVERESEDLDTEYSRTVPSLVQSSRNCRLYNSS